MGPCLYDQKTAVCLAPQCFHNIIYPDALDAANGDFMFGKLPFYFGAGVLFVTGTSPCHVIPFSLEALHFYIRMRLFRTREGLQTCFLHAHAIVLIQIALSRKMKLRRVATGTNVMVRCRAAFDVCRTAETLEAQYGDGEQQRQLFTEDEISEDVVLGSRLHAAGYKGVFVAENVATGEVRYSAVALE